MADHDQLKRDIDALRESVRLEWQEVEAKDLGASERLDLMNRIRRCVNELSLLLRKFEDLEKLTQHHA